MKNMLLICLLLVVVVALGCAGKSYGQAGSLDGTVVYVRHSATDDFKESGDTINLADCTTQRNLSEEGRERARMLGAFLKGERATPLEVLASPLCRCYETAELAIGEAEKIPELASFYWSSDAVRIERMDWLKGKLAEQVPSNQTRFLVGHKDFIQQLGIDAPGEGEAVVFRPQANGKFELVSRIKGPPYRMEPTTE